jgi:hypothetical protein
MTLHINTLRCQLRNSIGRQSRVCYARFQTLCFARESCAARHAGMYRDSCKIHTQASIFDVELLTRELSIFHVRWGEGKSGPVLTELTTPSRPKGEWSYSSTVLDLCTRWRWVDRFTTRPLYTLRKTPRYLLDRRLGGLQSQSGRGGLLKNLLPLPGIESWP